VGTSQRAGLQLESFPYDDRLVGFHPQFHPSVVAVDDAGQRSVLPRQLPENGDAFGFGGAAHTGGYYASRMVLPQFLLLDDSYSDVQAFVALVKRIGLVNSVRPVSTIAEAQSYLLTCDAARLPVVVFSGGAVRDGDGSVLFNWMDEQDLPFNAVPTIALSKPLEMYDIIASLKALALPERAKIDTTTLTVRVELWPHGTMLES
jgi:hypothetical protein